MFTINDDLSIYATRGDTVFFTVTAEENGTPYFFEAGDVLRMKIYGKKNAQDVVLEKCFPVTARTDRFTILLTEEDTKIGEVISKPKDYWYEIELNPFTNPQTIIGYDEDGAKVFKLFPEGKDSEEPEIDPEDIPVVDIELDMTSNRPVQNQAISRAIVNLEAAYRVTKEEVEKKAQETSNIVSNMGAEMNSTVANLEGELATERARIDNFVSGATADGAEVVDIRVGADGMTYASAGTAVREQIKNVSNKITTINYMSSWVQGGYTTKLGDFVANESYSDSERIPCLPNETYTITMKFPKGITANAILSVFNFYDAEEKYVAGYSTVLDDSPAVCTVDAEANTTVYTLTVPELDNIRYFTTYASNVHWEECEFHCVHGTDNNYRFNGGMPVSSLYFDKKIPSEYVEGVLDLKSGVQWAGKKWYAFGTSITDTSFVNAETGEVTGKYVPYLVGHSGLQVVNYGIAGGCIGSGGIHGGTSNILNKILETDVSTADLITIEGFVNDFACAVPIGNVGDTENTSICGALYQAVKHCLENSMATVVLLTESYGKEYRLNSTGSTANYCIDKKNSLNLLQKDYNEAIIKMGEYMGVPVIDCGAESHINHFRPEYIIDQIHHTELGGKQYAETIWDKLKDIHCNTDLL